MLAVSTYDGSIWLWELYHQEADATKLVSGTNDNNVDNAINSICFTSDNSTIAAGYLEKKVQFWDASKADTLKGSRTGFRGGVEALACSPTEALVAAANGNSIELLSYKPEK